MPIITDFSRRTQAFVRYLLDDVLRLDAEQDCPCGRHTRTIAAIEGRQDDVLWLPDLRNDALTALFPDSLRRAMLLRQDCFLDYRLEQHGLTWLGAPCGPCGAWKPIGPKHRSRRTCRAVPAVARAASRHPVCALATGRARDAGSKTAPHPLPAKTDSGKGKARMNILITGASGFVGGSFMRQFAAVPDLRLYGLGRRPLPDKTTVPDTPLDEDNYQSIDLSQPGARSLRLPFSPDVVIHAAARAAPWGSAGAFQAR